MMLLLGIWHNNYNLRYVSTTHVQFTFSAGTVFVLSAIQAISGPRLGRVTLASSLSQVETCLEYLAIIGQSWETAECAREILHNFFDETLKPRLVLRGGDANLKFELQDVDRRARARANSSASIPIKRASSADADVEAQRFPASMRTGPLSPSATAAASMAATPSMNELQYFPGSPTVSTLGWPILTGPPAKSPAEFFAHSGDVPSPTIDHVSFSHHSHPAHHSGAGTGDMDLDVGYSFPGMGLNGSSGNAFRHHHGGHQHQHHHHHHHHHSEVVTADIMAFGVPELGVSYAFDPHVPGTVALDFSAEELAIMDQIVRQQQQQQQPFAQPVG